jgi:hypothetical protein
MRKPFVSLLSRWLGSRVEYRSARNPLFTFWKARHQRRLEKIDRLGLYRSSARRRTPNFIPCYTSPNEKALVDKFCYDRLNWANNEIRLIKILQQEAGVVDSDYPIACKIVSVSLNEKPHYIALSYAWEDTTLSRPLVLNGKIFNATASLDAALRQIRKMGVQDTTFRDQYFWIDAL